jgi:predicted esterase
MIWLHGFGTNNHYVKDFWLDERYCKLPDSCKVIFPTAPLCRERKEWHELVSYWYQYPLPPNEANPAPEGEITDKYLNTTYHQKELRKSVDYIVKLIEREANLLQGRTENIFLGGMGQGCCIALAAFLKYKGGVLGGVYGSCGVFCAVTDWSEIDIQTKKKTPVYIQNEFYDPSVPEKYAK